MKLTKSKLKQIIKEEMQKALRESEDEYNVGEFVVVEISDDRYEKDIEKIDSDDVKSHISDDEARGPYLSAKFLAEIIHVSRGKYEPISEAPLNETQPKPQEVDQMEELMYVLFNPKGAIRKFYNNLSKETKPLLIQNLEMYAERFKDRPEFHEYLKILQTEEKSK